MISRRNLLQWLTPTLTAVALPSHAQCSAGFITSSIVNVSPVDGVLNIGDIVNVVIEYDSVNILSSRSILFNVFLLNNSGDVIIQKQEVSFQYTGSIIIPVEIIGSAGSPSEIITNVSATLVSIDACQEIIESTSDFAVNLNIDF